MNKVYVLGAGASKALNHGAPLMSELLQFGLFSPNSMPRSNPSRESKDEVQTFIRQFYGVNPREVVPPFEDILSQVDYCIVNNLPLSQKYNVNVLRKFRQHLIYVMGRAIQLNMENNTDTILTEHFAQQLNPQTDYIISLNYDLIIDNVLDRVGGKNYGVSFREDKKTTTSRMSLYKLHGSLNWLYCPVCRELDTTARKKGGLQTLIQNVPCPICKTPFEPMIITPSFLKDYNNPFIVQLWREAQLQLHQADEIVFVGYSMPDADIVLRMFFTRALYTNRLRNGKKQKYTIRVVDWVNPANRGVETDVYRRYKQLFGEIDYDDLGFADYITRGCRTVGENNQP